MDELWLRVGVSLLPNPEERVLLLQGDTHTLVQILCDGRFVFSGDTYIPEHTVLEETGKIGDISFELPTIAVK